MALHSKGRELVYVFLYLCLNVVSGVVVGRKGLYRIFAKQDAI